MQVRRWLFLAFPFALVAALAFWSLQLRSEQAGASAWKLPLRDRAAAHADTAQTARRGLQAAERSELLEVLDRIVAGEHDFQSVYGRFTRVIGQTGVSVPLLLEKTYEIVATEATSDRLRLTAISEWNGQIEDVVTIDQDFKIHASFMTPAPRSEYLREVALRNLRALHDPVTGEAPAMDAIRSLPADGELTLFQGYFDYFGGSHPTAIGKRAPVMGLQVEEKSPPATASASQESGRVPASLPEPSPSTIGLKVAKIPPPHAALVIERLSEDH